MNLSTPQATRACLCTVGCEKLPKIEGRKKKYSKNFDSEEKKKMGHVFVSSSSSLEKLNSL